jgi:hypothetical protein
VVGPWYSVLNFRSNVLKLLAKADRPRDYPHRPALADHKAGRNWTPDSDFQETGEEYVGSRAEYNRLMAVCPPVPCHPAPLLLCL